MSTDSKVPLQASNKQIFYVYKSVACQSRLIQNLINDTMNEDTGTHEPLLLPNVSSQILLKVIDYMEYHRQIENFAIPDAAIKQWDAAFVDVDMDKLFGLIWAADYLDIPNLLDLACGRLADWIKVKTPEEIRNTLNIQNDFSPEEIEQMRRERECFSPSV